jgi:hypothetical protein
MRGGENMTKKDFIINFLTAIQDRIPDFHPTIQDVERLFNDYYRDNPKFENYVDGIELAVNDAFEDGQNISLGDILDGWDENDYTTVASEITPNIEDDDDIEQFLGGKRTNKKRTNKKRTNKKRTNKKRTNKKRTNKKRTNKKGKMMKTKKCCKGGKTMTDTIYTEPIAYKEDEYDQLKNALNYKI